MIRRGLVALRAAAVLPTLLLMGAIALATLGGPAFPLPAWTAFVLWAVLTVPLTVAAIGATRVHASVGSEEDIRAALAKVERAESFVREQSETLHRAATANAAASPRTRSWARPAVAGLVGASVVAIALLLLVKAPLASADPVHIHATFALFDGNDRILFVDPYYDVSSRQFLRGHLHAPNQDVMHVEGKVGLTIRDFLEHGLDARVEGDLVALHGPVHQGRILMPDAARTWRVLVAANGTDDWQPTLDGFAYQPKDHDRILIILAGAREEVSAQAAAVGHDFPTV